jgi:hypothetical protein
LLAALMLSAAADGVMRGDGDQPLAIDLHLALHQRPRQDSNLRPAD